MWDNELGLYQVKPIRGNTKTDDVLQTEKIPKMVFDWKHHHVQAFSFKMAYIGGIFAAEDVGYCVDKEIRYWNVHSGRPYHWVVFILQLFSLCNPDRLELWPYILLLIYFHYVELCNVMTRI